MSSICIYRVQYVPDAAPDSHYTPPLSEAGTDFISIL